MVKQLDQQVDGGSTPSPSLHLPELYLEFCSSGDPRYLAIREGHYVPKKGNHGQQVHFLIWYKREIVGIISGGGAVYASGPRNAFFEMNHSNTERVINGIVDNTLFRLTLHEKNLGTRVLSLWEKSVAMIWEDLYGVKVFGFETFIVREGLLREIVTPTENFHGHQVILVPDPERNVRRGSLYKAANWTHCGISAGSTKGHDGVGLTGGRRGGKGKFKRKTTPPKDVYCKWAKGFSAVIESDYKSSWKAATPEGTPEEKVLAKEKAKKRKEYLGAYLYRKGKQTICEKLKSTT